MTSSPADSETMTQTDTQAKPDRDTFHANRAKRYDDTIRRVIPGYDALHSMTGVMLKDAVPADGRVLVVGAGTGAELLALGQAAPGWSFTACDPAAGMLAIAEDRIKGHPVAERCGLHPCLCADLPAEETAFDAATCLLVMHFLPDDGTKLALLKSIAERLKPGAPLILADMHETPGSPRHQLIMNAWMHWQLGNGIDPVEVEKGRRHVERDVHFVPLSRLTELLDEAGFTVPEHFFQAFLFGGFIAWRKTED